jgi:hypothetical protein
MALVWLAFCAAVVAVALFLNPKIDAPTPAAVDHAVPMAATVLYPNERNERAAEALKK